jgi:hypothetical protein
MTDSGLILFPEALLATVPALYSTEQTPTERKLAYIKVFDPCGRGTWYACEFNPDEGLFFGYVVSPLGPDCDEWGYFDKLELEQVTNRLGLRLERDVWWKPAPIPGLQQHDVGGAP